MYFVAILLDFSRFEIELSGPQTPFFRHLNTPILVVFSVFAKMSEGVNGNAVDFRSGKNGFAPIFLGGRKEDLAISVSSCLYCGILIWMRSSFFCCFRFPDCGVFA